jgi:hypothetical protein
LKLKNCAPILTRRVGVFVSAVPASQRLANLRARAPAIRRRGRVDHSSGRTASWARIRGSFPDIFLLFNRSE